MLEHLKGRLKSLSSQNGSPFYGAQIKTGGAVLRAFASSVAHPVQGVSPAESMLGAMHIRPMPAQQADQVRRSCLAALDQSRLEMAQAGISVAHADAIARPIYAAITESWMGYRIASHEPSIATLTRQKIALAASARALSAVAKGAMVAAFVDHTMPWGGHNASVELAALLDGAAQTMDKRYAVAAEIHRQVCRRAILSLTAMAESDPDLRQALSPYAPVAEDIKKMARELMGMIGQVEGALDKLKAEDAKTTPGGEP